ncbi:MAG: DNA polymerase III subunit epsilon [Methylococcales bacterium]
MSHQKKRQVVLDTETTGLNPQEGHRIIEIGCVELINRRLTKNHFHVYINPERNIDAGAIEVHGITNEFLNDKQLFKDVAQDFIAFIQDAELIIHNAPFDVGFLNHEFALLSDKIGRIEDFSTVFDSLVYARKKHPGQRNSLDALCKRYGIDNSHRELHGALLDAEILADVYLLMTGGQGSLLEEDLSSAVKHGEAIVRQLAPDRPHLKVIQCTEEELLTHERSLLTIQKASSDCVWLRDS